MDKTALSQLLATADDAELCAGIFRALADVTPPNFNAADEPEPRRTLTLVWAHSVIGSFHELWEGTFRGDPHFRQTAECYRTISAEPAYKAMHAALQLFPDSTLPEDVTARLAIYPSTPNKYRSHPEEV